MKASLIPSGFDFPHTGDERQGDLAENLSNPSSPVLPP